MFSRMTIYDGYIFEFVLVGREGYEQVCLDAMVKVLILKE